ncbi:hypothetical protein C3420_16450 [Acinetobacter sp. ACNIH3]|nr:hypothetical protein B9Y16_07785 [Acinetobacter baumannii]POU13748.1 hypothetical protein C3420_16450 [Acinetobacter sp. ACNIH3]POV71337.1 hypothetical protein C3422_19940 [Acinetobacter sp. ABNIH27]
MYLEEQLLIGLKGIKLEFQLYIYITLALLWWQLVRSRANIKRDITASEELGFWFFENPKISKMGLFSIKFLWLAIFLFPVYFAFEHSILKALAVLLVGNIGAIFIGEFLLKMGFPVKHILRLGAVLCPVLTIILIYTMV